MKRQILTAALIALALEGVVRFYGLFAHGVQSLDMEIMPVVAFIGSIVIFLMKRLRSKENQWTLWFDRLSVTALAMWINALFILGILDIAGGSSGYALGLIDLTIGVAFMALIVYVIGLLRNSHKKSTA